MKHVVVFFILFVLAVASLSILAYTEFVEQFVLPVPTLRASEGDSLHTLMKMFQAEEQLTIEVKRGVTSISTDENRKLFDVIYTQEEVDRLFKVIVNLVFNLNAQTGEQNILTQVEADYPAVRENLYLIGRFIDNFPFGFKVNIEFQSNNTNIQKGDNYG
jgi:tetrahydromethanopterin S-methyltransferase subunit B